MGGRRQLRTFTSTSSTTWEDEERLAVKAQPGRAPLPPEPRGRDYVDKLRQLQRRVLFATGKFYLTAAAWRLREHLLGYVHGTKGSGIVGQARRTAAGPSSLYKTQSLQPADKIWKWSGRTTRT